MDYDNLTYADAKGMLKQADGDWMQALAQGAKDFGNTAVQGAKDLGNIAVESFNNQDHRIPWHAGLGALTGAGLGAVSSRFQPKKRRNTLGRMLTGGMLGSLGGLGLAAATDTTIADNQAADTKAKQDKVDIATFEDLNNPSPPLTVEQIVMDLGNAGRDAYVGVRDHSDVEGKLGDITTRGGRYLANLYTGTGTDESNKAWAKSTPVFGQFADDEWAGPLANPSPYLGATMGAYLGGWRHRPGRLAAYIPRFGQEAFYKAVQKDLQKANRGQGHMSVPDGATDGKATLTAHQLRDARTAKVNHEKAQRKPNTDGTLTPAGQQEKAFLRRIFKGPGTAAALKGDYPGATHTDPNWDDAVQRQRRVKATKWKQIRKAGLYGLLAHLGIRFTQDMYGDRPDAVMREALRAAARTKAIADAAAAAEQ